MSGTLIHMPAYGQDLGYPLHQAVFVLSAGAAVGVFGKVLFGYVADRMDTRFAMLLSMSFQASAVFLLPRVQAYPALVAVGGLFGLGMGGIVPLWGSFVGEYFGRKSFGRVMGLMSPFMVPIQVSGVPFAGFMFDRTQSYATVFRVDLIIYLCTATLLLLLKKRDAKRTAGGIAHENA
jgi:MFS family permease